jgi:hypothetical protein
MFGISKKSLAGSFDGRAKVLMIQLFEALTNVRSVTSGGFFLVAPVKSG